jgi:type II secretory pathway component PulF
VRSDVEQGASLADAMRKHPKTFDPLFTNMIAAGEAGGILDVILQRLSTFIEKQAKLVSQVRSAMIYPIAVLSIAAIVVTVIMIKVVPTFTDLFRGLNAKLPAITLAVIWISNKMIIALPFMVTCSSSRSILRPVVSSSLSIVRTSCRRGTLYRCRSPAVSRPAHRMGSAAFLAPEIAMSPCRRLPPTIWSLSMISL